MYNFFVAPDAIVDSQVRITGSDYNHMKNVLRMKPGETVYISTGSDDASYDCVIESYDRDAVNLRIVAKLEEGLELPARVTLFQGLPKQEKMEWIIQKAVELGVYEIVPVSTKRSIMKLDAKKAKSKVERWQGIAESAAKQSKRRLIPEIREVMSVKEALSYMTDFDVKLLPYENAEGMPKTKNIIENIKPLERVAIMIGPEGGFAEEEVSLCEENGMETITLGRRILRTETAGMTVLAWIMYQLEQ